MPNTIKEDLPQYDFFSEIASNGLCWIERELENPKNKIRLATMFSGIGAVKYALKRLKISNEIIFASDYGVPQYGQRIFTIGFQENTVNFDFPKENSLQDYIESKPSLNKDSKST